MCQAKLIVPSIFLFHMQAQLAKADEEQVRMMEERVILTDYYDNCIGDGSKKDSE
jgi:hypothetical protein